MRHYVVDVCPRKMWTQKRYPWRIFKNTTQKNMKRIEYKDTKYDYSFHNEIFDVK